MSDRGVIVSVAARRTLIMGVHLALWTVAIFAALVLRFDLSVPRQYARAVPVWVPVLLALRVALFHRFGLFRGLWRYTGAADLVAIVFATTISSALFAGFLAYLHPGMHFPRSVPLIEWLVALVLVAGLRFTVRSLRSSSRLLAKCGGTRVLIVGAGDAGEMLLREMKSRLTGRWHPVGLLDDDAGKRGTQIHGVRVYGAIATLPRVVTDLCVDEVIIAVPSATGAEMRRIVDTCKEAGVRFKTIPGMDHLIDGRVEVSQLRNVEIEDLLGREPIELDSDEISRELGGEVVMVTGAGGSIGSEICRQLCRFEPAALLLVERAENALFNVHRELIAKFPHLRIVPCVADVADRERMTVLFEAHRPAAVFHAAAHKHVPMMEWNPGEAVKNNVVGTRTLADLADGHGVARFVMISTDKAVNPTSVMGVSKRVAEIYVQALSQRSRTRFVTVRFGNVLGSAGSVIPIFQEQIAAGGPVTVTHPEMRRYFMTIPEASQLVLQAGAMGHGGEIFILDMGAPVKIADLARDLITLSGLRPGEDIEIAFTGLRPGEKLFEELSVDEEHAEKTKHPKIFVGRFRRHAWEHVQRQVRDLAEHAEGRPQDTRRRLVEIVPEYRPSTPVVAPLPLRAEAVRKVAND